MNTSLGSYEAAVAGNLAGVAQPALHAELQGNWSLHPASRSSSRIAGILSAYDDLIENNQRRIQILGAMARALYREWFVEFRFPWATRISARGLPLWRDSRRLGGRTP